MNDKLTVSRFTPLALFLFIFLLAISGCSSGPDMEAQISGKWQRAQGDGMIDINLAGTPKTLVMDGHTYNAVVEKVDKGTSTIKVKVETEAGQSEVWSITQRWNDNGSSFKLTFRHNGTTDTLEPVGKS